MPAVGMSQFIIRGNNHSFSAGASSLNAVKVDDLYNKSIFSGIFQIKFTDVENNENRNTPYALDVSNGAETEILSNRKNDEDKLIPVDIHTTVKKGVNGSSYDVGGILIGGVSEVSENNSKKASVTGKTLSVKAVSDGIVVNNGILKLSNSTIESGATGISTLSGGNEVNIDDTVINAKNGIDFSKETNFVGNNVIVNATDSAMIVGGGSEGTITDSRLESSPTKGVAITISGEDIDKTKQKKREPL